MHTLLYIRTSYRLVAAKSKQKHTHTRCPAQRKRSKYQFYFSRAERIRRARHITRYKMPLAMLPVRFILNTSLFFLRSFDVAFVGEKEQRAKKTPMQNKNNIRNHRTVSWFWGEKLRSHALYASFITILVFETSSLEKCKTHRCRCCWVQNDNFMFWTGLQVLIFFFRSHWCFIECETNKSTIRQVMQYFMWTHSFILCDFLIFISIFFQSQVLFSVYSLVFELFSWNRENELGNWKKRRNTLNFCCLVCWFNDLRHSTNTCVSRICFTFSLNSIH